MSFLSHCFQHVFFIFIFHVFDYLYVLAWISLSVYCLVVYWWYILVVYFFPIQEIFSDHFFDYLDSSIFFLLSFQCSNGKNVRYFVIVPQFLRLRLFFPICIFLSLAQIELFLLLYFSTHWFFLLLPPFCYCVAIYFLFFGFYGYFWFYFMVIMFSNFKNSLGSSLYVLFLYWEFQIFYVFQACVQFLPEEFFMMILLKSLSDNFNIPVILALGSTSYTFFHLIWNLPMMSNF